MRIWPYVLIATICSCLSSVGHRPPQTEVYEPRSRILSTRKKRKIMVSMRRKRWVLFVGSLALRWLPLVSKAALSNDFSHWSINTNSKIARKAQTFAESCDIFVPILQCSSLWFGVSCSVFQVERQLTEEQINGKMSVSFKISEDVIFIFIFWL